VTGYVSGIPEEKNSKQVFTVRVTDVDGRPCGGKLLVHYYSKSGQVEQGDPVSFHCVLMRPPPAKNPGGFDYEGYLRRMNIYTVAYVSSLDKIGHGRTPFYRRLAQSVNLDMNETIDKALPQSESAVLIPMLIGNKQNLSYEEKQAFTDAGVMHILVVSGLKVAYVAGTFLLLFRLMGLKRRLASLLSIPFLLLYMAVTGNNPPVVRATIMAISIFISLSLNRSSLTYQALALAAAVILIFDPQALFTASFQLSFAATIGIVYLYPRLIKPFQKFPAWFRNPVGGSIAVSLASQLGVMPLLSFYFHKIFFAGIISNILIVPLTGVITGLGIVLYLVHFISGPLTSFAAWITSFLIKLLMLQVHYFANLPYAAVHVATPALWGVGVYYLI
jgi:competence protein ComEC